MWEKENHRPTTETTPNSSSWLLWIHIFIVGALFIQHSFFYHSLAEFVHLFHYYYVIEHTSVWNMKNIYKISKRNRRRRRRRRWSFVGKSLGLDVVVQFRLMRGTHNPMRYTRVRVTTRQCVMLPSTNGPTVDAVPKCPQPFNNRHSPQHSTLTHTHSAYRFIEWKIKRHNFACSCQFVFCVTSSDCI